MGVEVGKEFGISELDKPRAIVGDGIEGAREVKVLREVTVEALM